MPSWRNAHQVHMGKTLKAPQVPKGGVHQAAMSGTMILPHGYWVRWTLDVQTSEGVMYWALATLEDRIYHLHGSAIDRSNNRPTQSLYADCPRIPSAITDRSLAIAFASMVGSLISSGYL